MLVMLASVQKRFWANGKSRLMVKQATLSLSSARALSKRLVCSLHTGVSSDGTTLNRRALPGVLARVTISRPLLTQAKSGALLPGLSSGPTSVNEDSLNFTAFG